MSILSFAESSAAIRSLELVGRTIDFHVRCNLRELFIEDSYPTTVTDAVRSEIYAMYRENIGRDVPAFSLARQVARQYKVEEREASAILRQGVWRRDLRVDLFQPVLMDKALRPETTDVLDRYADWFRR